MFPIIYQYIYGTPFSSRWGFLSTGLYLLWPKQVVCPTSPHCYSLVSWFLARTELIFSQWLWGDRARGCVGCLGSYSEALHLTSQGILTSQGKWAWLMVRKKKKQCGCKWSVCPCLLSQDYVRLVRVIFVHLDFVNSSFLYFCYQYHCSLYLIIVSSKLFFISICNLCFLCLLLEEEQGSCICFEILVAGWSLNLGLPFLNHDFVDHKVWK